MEISYCFNLALPLRGTSNCNSLEILSFSVPLLKWQKPLKEPEGTDPLHRKG